MSAHTATRLQEQLFAVWIRRLHYRDIRQSEVLQPSMVDNHRVRGVPIADDIVVARDGIVYDVSEPIAVALTPEQVMSRYTFEQIQDRYLASVQQADARRRMTRHHA